MTENILEGRSINKIKSAIKKLEEHKTHLIPYDKYLHLMSEALSDTTLYTLNDMVVFNEEGYGIFRARSVTNNVPYSLVEDMWAKKPALVTDYGRCNNKNVSRFYCSNFFLTCLIECRAKENSKWVLAEYEKSTDAKILTLPIGINEHIFNNKPKTYLNPGQVKKNDIILRFVRDSYKKFVSPTDTSRYLKTIAITDFFFKSPQIAGKESCIMYPSVADYNKNVNYVFYPEIAKRNLKIKRAYYIEVVKLSVDKKQHVAELKFLADGVVVGDKIEWTTNHVPPFKKHLQIKLNI